MDRPVKISPPVVAVRMPVLCTLCLLSFSVSGFVRLFRPHGSFPSHLFYWILLSWYHSSVDLLRLLRLSSLVDLIIFVRLFRVVHMVFQTLCPILNLDLS